MRSHNKGVSTAALFVSRWDSFRLPKVLFWLNKMVDGLVCEYQEQQKNEHYQQEREISWQKMTSNQVIETSITIFSLQGSQFYHTELTKVTLRAIAFRQS